MVEEKIKKLEELCALAVNGTETTRPKRALFGLKCPKCGGKLAKDSAKAMVLVGEEGSEIINKVVTEAQYGPGVYTVKVDHFTCGCGYEFFKTDVSEPAGGD